MKIKDIVSQLANRINQPHVIEVYLRQVYAKGFVDGTKQSPWISVKDRLPEENTEEGRKVGADNLIEQASANGQKKYQQGMDFMKSKAIEAFRVMGEETRFDITTDVLIKAEEIFMRELNKTR